MCAQRAADQPPGLRGSCFPTAGPLGSVGGTSRWDSLRPSRQSCVRWQTRFQGLPACVPSLREVGAGHSPRFKPHLCPARCSRPPGSAPPQGVGLQAPPRDGHVRVAGG